MSNTLLTPQVIAQEFLFAVENNCVMGGLVYHAYEGEFKHVGSTVTVRKPAVYSATNMYGSSTVSVNNITESSVNVVVDRLYDITLEVTSEQLALDIVDFTEQVIAPAGRAMAQTVDAELCSLATAVAGHYPVSATPAVSDVAGVAAVLDMQKAPLTDRRLVFHPITKADYISLDSFLHASKRGDGGQALRTAELGNVMGFDCYMDQNIQTHTVNSTFGDLAGAIDGSVSAAATTMQIDALTDADVISAGDVFKVTGHDQWFRVTTNSTVGAGGAGGTANEALVVFSPAANSGIADNAVVTFQNTHRMNLAFHKNAFCMVSPPLEPPLGGAKAASLSYNGLSCRVVYDYEMRSKKNLISIDMLAGYATLDKDLAARFCDAR